MKQLISIIILLQTGISFAQKPYAGTYTGHRNFSSALTITFKNDSIFDAKSSGCRSWNKGAGKFTVTKKELFLNFTDSITPYTKGHVDRT